MSTFKAMWCVIAGHDVSIESQKELKKLSKQIDAECERCGYPLRLELDSKDQNHFYYTEQPTYRNDIPKIRL